MTLGSFQYDWPVESVAQVSENELRAAFVLASELSLGRGGPRLPEQAFYALFAATIEDDPFLRRLSVEAPVVNAVSALQADDEIDTLYAALSALHRAPSSAGRDAEKSRLFSRLRRLQTAEAARMERMLSARAEIELGGVDKAIQRAEELLGKR